MALCSAFCLFFVLCFVALCTDAYCGSVFNIVFTSVPPLLIAVFDRDISRENLIKYPALYASGLKNQCFNVQLLLRIICEGVLHSLALYFCSFFLYTGAGDILTSGGLSSDLWVFSTAMYTYLVVVVNGRMALDTSTHTWFNDGFLIASVLVWFAFALAYCGVGVTADMLWVAELLYSTPSFWLGLLLVPAICLVPEVALRFARRMYFPTQKDIVMENERGYKYNANERNSRRRGTSAKIANYNNGIVTAPTSASPKLNASYGATSSVPAESDVVLVHASASPVRKSSVLGAFGSSSSRLLHSPAHGPFATSSKLGNGSGLSDIIAPGEEDMAPIVSRNGLFPPPQLILGPSAPAAAAYQQQNNIHNGGLSNSSSYYGNANSPQPSPVASPSDVTPSRVPIAMERLPPQASLQQHQQYPHASSSSSNGARRMSVSQDQHGAPAVTIHLAPGHSSDFGSGSIVQPSLMVTPPVSARRISSKQLLSSNGSPRLTGIPSPSSSPLPAHPSYGERRRSLNAGNVTATR